MEKLDRTEEELGNCGWQLFQRISVHVTNNGISVICEVNEYWGVAILSVTSVYTINSVNTIPTVTEIEIPVNVIGKIASGHQVAVILILEVLAVNTILKDFPGWLVCIVNQSNVHGVAHTDNITSLILCLRIPHTSIMPVLTILSVNTISTVHNQWNILSIQNLNVAWCGIIYKSKYQMPVSKHAVCNNN